MTFSRESLQPDYVSQSNGAKGYVVDLNFSDASERYVAAMSGNENLYLLPVRSQQTANHDRPELRTASGLPTSIPLTPASKANWRRFWDLRR